MLSTHGFYRRPTPQLCIWRHVYRRHALYLEAFPVVGSMLGIRRHVL